MRCGCAQELRHLNVAVNNLTKVQNLQGCESLAKLDLSVNFIPLAGLLSLASLQRNGALRELHLLGNPCSQWPRYRGYVVGLLPQLRQLVGACADPACQFPHCMLPQPQLGSLPPSSQHHQQAELGHLA